MLRFKMRFESLDLRTFARAFHAFKANEETLRRWAKNRAKIGEIRFEFHPERVTKRDLKVADFFHDRPSFSWIRLL